LEGGRHLWSLAVEFGEGMKARRKEGSKTMILLRLRVYSLKILARLL
jgi:hypothetical protein